MRLFIDGGIEDMQDIHITAGMNVLPALSQSRLAQSVPNSQITCITMTDLAGSDHQHQDKR